MPCCDFVCACTRLSLAVFLCVRLLVVTGLVEKVVKVILSVRMSVDVFACAYICACMRTFLPLCVYDRTHV